MDLFSCLFKVSNGSNKKKVIPEDDDDIKKAKYFANSLNSCVAVLRQVPNQRLYFKNDPRLGQKGRTGDYLIAWTWHHFVKSRFSRKSNSSSYKSSFKSSYYSKLIIEKPFKVSKPTRMAC